MTDDLSRKQFTGLTAGLAVLGFAWIVAAGIMRDSFWLAAIPFILGTAGVIGGLKLYLLKPERAYAILGAFILWCIVVNFVFANVLSFSEPWESNEVAAKISAAHLMTFNIQLGFLSLLGFFFLVADLLRKK